MANLMPLVHHARRTIRNRHEGNPFTMDEAIAEMGDAVVGEVIGLDHDLGSSCGSTPE